MSSSRPPRFRRRVTVVVVGAAVVLLTLGGASAAVAASNGSAAPGGTAAASCTPRLGAVLRALPRSLHADLHHLRTDAKGNRTADRAAIARKALAGGYGAEVQRVAAIAGGSTGHLAPALPAALRADLKALRADPKGSAERKAQAATIVRKAEAGDYGAPFRAAARQAEARAAQRCATASHGS